ncbi:MAG: 3-deoxy-8-phosphooctulonate synthase [Alphaproteobacteria bacterium]|nr:3-deoxy-8-phosphooctulonate synthase [Alphaproteobacteria bacterium]MCL2506013.1 3-deoxy-8-phosphooctulonate synthase [Alphaproteobacteria bacterium]
MKHVKITAPNNKVITIGNNLPLVFILGPCQMESREHALMASARIKEIAEEFKIDVIYKTSFDKANRSSISTQRGVGLEAAIPIFKEIREKTGLPILTDVHEKEHCRVLADAVDVLQIPAFLSRQTDLLVEAGKTGKVINVKKGQFLAPWDMKNVAEKIASTGNDHILLTERGVSFGYNTLVSDMRSLPIMASTGYPVVFDATHSVQQPGGLGKSSGGQKEFVPVLARAAVAVGVAALFFEVHENPSTAPSDGPNMLNFEELAENIKILKQLDAIAKGM